MTKKNLSRRPEIRFFFSIIQFHIKFNQTYNTKLMFKQTKLNQKFVKLHFSLSQFPYENQPSNQNRFEYSYE